MRSLSLLLSAAVGLALASCGDDSRRAPNGLTAAVESLVAARCERMLACSQAIRPLPSSIAEQSCARSRGWLCGLELEHLPQQDLERCASALRRQDCGLLRWISWPAGCEAIERSITREFDLGDQGEPCGALCGPGLTCQGIQNDCAGTCIPTFGEGHACALSHDCGDSTVCSSAKVCERPRSAGASCRTALDCEHECIDGLCWNPEDLLDRPCTDEAGSCGAALRCLDGRCAPLAEVGMRCEGSHECVDGSSCIDRRCALASACRTGRLGDACADNAQCVRGLACHVTERRCAPQRRAGETCSFEVRCAAGLACIDPGADVEGTCKVLEPLPNGSKCTFFPECESGFCGGGECHPLVACEPS